MWKANEDQGGCGMGECRSFKIEEIRFDEPSDDEVLVRLVSSGVCRTDLEARGGHLPIPEPPGVCGHEGAGVVERNGRQVKKVLPGDHVVLGWSSCGECVACRSARDKVFSRSQARKKGRR
jgi:aryl-alcohol dehydrogenase